MIIASKTLGIADIVYLLHLIVYLLFTEIYLFLDNTHDSVDFKFIVGSLLLEFRIFGKRWKDGDHLFLGTSFLVFTGCDLYQLCSRRSSLGFV